MPARNHSASRLMNLVSSYLAFARPVSSSSSEMAKTFFPSLFLRDTWVCLNRLTSEHWFGIPEFQLTRCIPEATQDASGMNSNLQQNLNAYISPWLSHKTRYYSIIYTHTLCGIFEQDCVVCHPKGTSISQGGL